MDIRREEYEHINFFARFLYDEEQNIFVIVLSGPLDKEPILKIKKRLEQLISPHQYNFIVDISQTTYISSTGLGFLIYIMKQKKDYTFISYPATEILQPIKLLEMDEFFNFYYNLKELQMRTEIPDKIMQVIEDETTSINTKKYDERWKNMLKNYYTTNEETEQAIIGMLPFIDMAENNKTIAVPSEDIYSCVLYHYLHRVLREIAKIREDEIDDVLVELVAKELMVNSVKHGYEYRNDGMVEANYYIDGKKLMIYVIDYGKGFPPKKISKTHLPHSGLELLAKLFDKLEVGSAPRKDVNCAVLGKGTTVRLTKNLKPKRANKDL
jgi:anti-anti-sigma factor